MKLVKWFHHLLNPHCPECTHEHECKNCAVLRGLLDQEKFEKKEILEKLLHKDDKPVIQNSELPLEISKPRHIPWSVRQQMLETEDRLASKARKDLTEKLEEELEIGNATQ